ncbi:MAG: OsmC family peroxiredoxin [Acidobacteria bacterium RIFCSPLOWO2_12_FULL_65_11]|nr:MAG: OsmC family peroxiredoxin [Acidobacteria bacterium RIFCSPLOWO2_02_FULL_64_15]OFW29820.1 MAG: OsmC family peroxiredoxin [Acidobacteria bacterium RIFCSPLOWO2_12_FULL_65_11]
MKRSASAVWSGGLKDGEGTVSAESGALSGVPYNFTKRFESEKGTNPEELIAAAHAACFSMALSLFMANEGLKPESIDTSATVSFDNVNGAWTVTESHLKTTVKSPGANAAAFQKAAEGAKAGCPISRLLNTKITLDARLA